MTLSNMSSQSLDNKALSWGISGKSAPLFAEITIRKRQQFPELGETRFSLSSPACLFVNCYATMKPL
jgi:hypothetical protein